MQFLLLNEWRRVCDQTHNHDFTADVVLPTRVLDVGQGDNPRIRLRDGASVGPGRYVALSHCWGEGPNFSLFRSNMDQFQQNIDFDQLPRCFQDAVAVTRVFGVRYLWIDSLCIIQGNDPDWEREAGRMEQVFSSAYCTIAATSASSSAEGFLVNREPRPFASVNNPSGGTTYVCESVDNFHQDVEEGNLNKRGWVLQERALSRRSVHFTATQVYWECGKGVHCESLMKLAK